MHLRRTIVVLSLAVVPLGGCGLGAGRPGFDANSVAVHSAFCARNRGSQCARLDHGRFLVDVGDHVAFLGYHAHLNVDQIIENALARIGPNLPGPDMQIDFSATARDVFPEVGVGSELDYVTGDGYIEIAPTSRAPLAEALNVWLPRSISHLVNHAVRLKDVGAPSTLLDALIFEGVADAFDYQVWGDVPLHPWDVAINASSEAMLWQKAKRVLTVPDPEAYNIWFLGRGAIPRWAGFVLGYGIVKAYLDRHPGLTAASLVGMPSRAILQGSHFAP